MFATHGTRCPSETEDIEMQKLTKLRDHIISNHEVQNSEFVIFFHFKMRKLTDD